MRINLSGILTIAFALCSLFIPGWSFNHFNHVNSLTPSSSLVFTSAGTPSFTQTSQATILQVVPSPSGSPYSHQPVYVFVRASGQGSPVNLKLQANFTLTLYTNVPVLSYLNGRGITVSYPTRVRLIPFPGLQGWYFTIIPGASSYYQPVRILSTTYFINITTSVSYSLYEDDSLYGTYSYRVLQQEQPAYPLPPTVGAFVTSSLNDSSVWQETYGLSPSGWVADQNEQVPLTTIAFSPNGIQSLGAQYSKDGASWFNLTMTQDPINSALNLTVNTVNQWINTVNGWVGSLLPHNFTEISLPLSVADTSIPNVPITGDGVYVQFRATAVDNNNTLGQSPMGLYYIVDDTKPRVLAIDPHVQDYLLLKNALMYTNQVIADSRGGLPSFVIDNNTLLARASQLATGAVTSQFHQWHRLGKYYNIRISTPNPNIANLLQPQTSGGFGPAAIYLSDLSLGFSSQTGGVTGFFDWDLNDTKDVNGATILSDIIKYTKTCHTGLLGSAGTLSDWSIWTSSDPSSAIKIGARGHVGEGVRDANPWDETTFASMFGLPLLPVFESVRDTIASALSAYPLVSQLVGSTPLLVPIMPWDGALAIPNSKFIPNVNPAIMSGISGFNVSIPGYQQFGSNAVTTVGWQLSLPSVLADWAWKAANASRSQLARLNQTLISLSANLTGTSKSAPAYGQLDYSLNRWLHDLYGSIARASINDTGVIVTVYIPNYGDFTRFIPIDIKSIVGLWPIKIAALSPDDAAGIVTYDKFYDNNGYRSVYFSFPIESSSQ